MRIKKNINITLALIIATFSLPNSDTNIQRKAQIQSNEQIQDYNNNYHVYNFIKDYFSFNFEDTKREITTLCLDSYSKKEETGGYNYIDRSQVKLTDNRITYDRIGFRQIPNSINKSSKVRKEYYDGIMPSIEDIEEELKEKHVERRCSKYNTDEYWKEEIDSIRDEIRTIRNMPDKNTESIAEVTRRLLELNNASYLPSYSLDSLPEKVGNFHTHDKPVGFSPVDHCLFDKSAERHYVIGCDYENKTFTVYTLNEGRDIIVLKERFIR